MARAKKMKLVITNEVKDMLNKPFQELISRGAEDFDLCEIIAKVLALPEANPVIDAFVNQCTPESYKINQLLNNPAEREKVLELLQNKTFGLDSSDSGYEQSKGL